MKKVLTLLVLFLVLGMIGGCQKEAPIKNWSDFSIATLEDTSSPAILLKETVQLGDFSLNKGAEYTRVIGVSPLTITTISGAGGTATVVEFDRYSKDTIKQATLNGVGTYITSYSLKGSLYVLCAKEIEVGLKISLTDVWNNKEAATFVSEKLPFTAQLKNTIILSSTEDSGTKNTLHKFENGSLQAISSYTCKVSKDGNVTGDIITALGGYKDTLWVQISKPKNQPLPEARVIIEQYQSKDQVVKEKGDLVQTTLELTNKVTTTTPFQFLFGDSKVVLGGLYGYAKPVLDSGVLMCLDAKNILTLPDVTSGHDINFAAPWGDGYIYGTPSGMGYIDFNTMTQEPLYSGDIFSAVTSDGIIALQTAEAEVVLLQSNLPQFIGEIEEATAKNLKTAMNLPNIQVLHKTQNNLYYLESSTYKQRQNSSSQKADAVVWEYNNSTGACVQLAQFDYIFLENPIATIDNEKQTLSISADPVGGSKKEITVSIQ